MKILTKTQNQMMFVGAVHGCVTDEPHATKYYCTVKNFSWPKEKVAASSKTTLKKTINEAIKIRINAKENKFDMEATNN